MLAANATFKVDVPAPLSSPPQQPVPDSDLRRRGIVDRDSEEDLDDTGFLFVEGYVRSRPLSANQLVHITGVGTFKLACITLAPDPCPTKTQRNSRAGGGADAVEVATAGAMVDDEDGDGGVGEGGGGMMRGELMCSAACGAGVVVSVRNESVAHDIESQVCN